MHFIFSEIPPGSLEVIFDHKKKLLTFSYELVAQGRSFIYSVRKDFTGLVIAAFID
jgi:hypothetical protein